MTDLFQSRKQLEQWCQTSAPSESQKQFILSILKGNEARASLNDIVTYRKKEDLLDLQKSIKLMIQDTPYYSSKKFNFSFIQRLKNLLRDIEMMQKSEETLADFANKNPEKHQKYIELFDSLYQTTEHQFKGTLMMPVMQAMDARLGGSQGACFGYIAEWASQLHQNKKFMGASANGVSPFKRVTVNSKAWSKYPDLNHLDFLTPNISYQQSLQTDIPGLTRHLSIPFLTRNQNISYKEGNEKFYISITQIAEELIQLSEKQPEDIYNLNLRGYFSRHALGFCKMNDQYHFMDSNSGWFRFENAEDFKKWLPFYFQKVRYDKQFAEYIINTYSLNSMSKNADSAKKEKDAFKMSIGNAILFTLLSPIIIIGLLAFLTNFFIIRGIRYTILALGHLLKREKPFPVEVQDNSSHAVSEPLPKSLDHLDLAINPVSFVEKNTSSSTLKIASMLDIPLKDLVKDLVEVQKRAETSDEFKRVKMKPLFERFSKSDSVAELSKKCVV